MKKGHIYALGWGALAITGLLTLPSQLPLLENKVAAKGSIALAAAGLGGLNLKTEGQALKITALDGMSLSADDVAKVRAVLETTLKPSLLSGPVTVLNFDGLKVPEINLADASLSAVDISPMAAASASIAPVVTPIPPKVEILAPAPAPKAPVAAVDAKPKSGISKAALRACQRNASAIMARHDLSFRFNDASLTAEGRRNVNKLARAIKNCPKGVIVTLQGHTDNIGPATANKWLARERAKTTAKALIRTGIAPKRVRFESYGETMPKAKNTTAKGRMENRRVDVVITASRKG
jgi:outer membrane protein OmpA-like peptidoglycan-associated protein